MHNRLFRGLWAGFALGLLYAWADTLLTYTLLRENIGLTFPPFTLTTVRLMVLATALCTVFGGVLFLIAGKWLERRPGWVVNAMAAFLFIVAFFASPAIDRIFAMGAMGILLMAGLGHAYVRWVRPHAGLLFSLIPALWVLWFAVLGRGLPPNLDREADPNRPLPSVSAPNILFVVFDTTRVDRVSTFGHFHETTPTLDKLASEGAAFNQAFATSSWTLASHASMFTGLYSVQNNCHSQHTYLNSRFTTLAEQLYAAGYDTAMFSGNPWLDDYTGLSRGYSLVHPSWRNYTLGNLFVIGRLEILFIKGGQDKGAIESREAFKAWFEEEKTNDRPFFAFFNYFEAHNPYHQIPFADRDRFLPEGKTDKDADAIGYAYNDRIMYVNDFVATPEERDLMMCVYDGGIYNMDTRLSEIIGIIEEAGKLDDTLVIVVGDHGEMFGELGTYIHEYQLYQPLLHVPLVMRWPGRIPAGARYDTPVEISDLHDTVLEYAGLGDAISKKTANHSLSHVIAGEGDPERAVFAEVFPSHLKNLRDEIRRLGYDPKTWRLWSVKKGDLAMIRFPDGDRLYDLSIDPGQEKNVAAQRPEEAAKLSALIDDFIIKHPPPSVPDDIPPSEIDDATKEQLKAMGYVFD